MLEVLREATLMYWERGSPNQEQGLNGQRLRGRSLPVGEIT